MEKEEKLIQKINENCEYEPNFDLIKNKIVYKTVHKKSFTLAFKRIGLSFACILIIAFGFAMILLPNINKANNPKAEEPEPSSLEKKVEIDGSTNVIKGIKVYNDEEFQHDGSLEPYSPLYTAQIASAFTNVYQINIEEFDIVYLEKGNYFVANVNERELILSEEEVIEANENK